MSAARRGPFTRRRLLLLLAALPIVGTAVAGSASAGYAVALAALPPSALSAVRSSTTHDTLSVHWPASPGASEYLVTVASDPALHHTVKSATVHGTSVRADGLTQGTDYYYRITPVSAWGTRGTATAVASDRTAVVPLPVPQNVTITAATTDSVRVGWSPVPGAEKYSVEVFDAQSGGTRIATVGPVTRASATVDHLPTAAVGRDFFVEVRATRADGVHSLSGRVQANTVPEVPTDLHAVASSPTGVTVAWKPARDAQGYRVERSDDASFDHVVAHYDVPYAYTRLAVNDLAPGDTAYLRVRAVNGAMTGGPGPSIRVKVPKVKHTMDLRVATFNVLNLRHDKTLAPWNVRRQSVADIINTAHPDVLGLQEASQSATSKTDGKTQVDDIASMTSPKLTRLPAPSARGTQMLYNKAKLKALKPAGIIELPLFPDDTPRLAGWQEFQDRHTHTKFIVVNTHLTNGPGTAQDAVREKQADTILHALAHINKHKLPVIFTGDLNSFDQRTAVTPMSLLAAHGYLDTDHSAAVRTNDELNSLNGYYDDAYKNMQGIKLDHVIASETVGVRGYTVVPGATAPGGTPTATASDHRLIYADLVLHAPDKKSKKK